MQQKNIVKKDNSLINAAYTLTLAEQRLILLSIVEAAGQPSELKDMVVHAGAYADRFNVTQETAYESLRGASKQLFERKFSYESITAKGNKSHVTSRWVQRIEYVKKEALVKLRFADDVIPLLCDLKNRFTAYSLEAVSDLSSVHAIRLYELLIAWRSTLKTPTYEVAELRQKLGIADNEYQRMSDFKRRVLDFALAQINEHSDITAEYEQHKRGRTITGFTFSFEIKNERVDNKTIDMFTGQSDSETSKPKRKKITKKEAEQLARVGESWTELLARLTTDYYIVDL